MICIIVPALDRAGAGRGRVIHSRKPRRLGEKQEKPKRRKRASAAVRRRAKQCGDAREEGPRSLRFPGAAPTVETRRRDASPAARHRLPSRDAKAATAGHSRAAGRASRRGVPVPTGGGGARGVRGRDLRRHHARDRQEGRISREGALTTTERGKSGMDNKYASKARKSIRLDEQWRCSGVSDSRGAGSRGGVLGETRTRCERHAGKEPVAAIELSGTLRRASRPRQIDRPRRGRVRT